LYLFKVALWELLETEGSMNTEFLLTSLVVILLIPETGIVYAVSNGLSSVTG